MFHQNVLELLESKPRNSWNPHNTRILSCCFPHEQVRHLKGGVRPLGFRVFVFFPCFFFFFFSSRVLKILILAGLNSFTISCDMALFLKKKTFFSRLGEFTPFETSFPFFLICFLLFFISLSLFLLSSFLFFWFFLKPRGRLLKHACCGSLVGGGPSHTQRFSRRKATYGERLSKLEPLFELFHSLFFSFFIFHIPSFSFRFLLIFRSFFEFSVFLMCSHFGFVSSKNCFIFQFFHFFIFSSYSDLFKQKIVFFLFVFFFFSFHRFF